MKRRLTILLSCFLVWTITPAVAIAQTELNREAALKTLENSDAETRVAAADRLGEVGTMDDVVPLLNSLRDENELVRNTAEQSIWRIWARSGDPAVDRLYARGIREMNEGSFARAISTFTEIIKLKPARNTRSRSSRARRRPTGWSSRRRWSRPSARKPA